MPEPVTFIESVLRVYKKLFSRYPYITGLVVVGYIVAFIAFGNWRDMRDRIRALSHAKELQARILDLEMQRRQQDEILAALASAKGSQAEFLKPLKFADEWRDDRSRQEVGRLVDYAEYAMSKNDFDHAERFYQEADRLQPTVTIPYYEGRLAYKRGDLRKAESEWLEAIKRDPEGRYPDLRLYLGILYYQLGRTTEARSYIGYFQIREKPRTGPLDKP